MGEVLFVGSECLQTFVFKSKIQETCIGDSSAFPAIPAWTI